MHAALPFLCLGIGIDDMFVIVQCMTNLKTEPGYDTWGLDRKLGLWCRSCHANARV